MARTRLSTTVNADLLADARRVRSGLTDAALIDEVLQAFLARHRAAEVDAGYAGYDEHPLDEPDAWGDLASSAKLRRPLERDAGSRRAVVVRAPGGWPSPGRRAVPRRRDTAPS